MPACDENRVRGDLQLSATVTDRLGITGLIVERLGADREAITEAGA